MRIMTLLVGTAIEQKDKMELPVCLTAGSMHLSVCV